MTIEDQAEVERELAGLPKGIRQEVSATAEQVRQLQRTISSAAAVPILILLGWPVMVPSLISLLLRVGRLVASSELREPLRWAARLSAQDRPPMGARGVVADVVVLSRARTALWACLIVPPVVAVCMGTALFWVLREL